MSIEPARLQDTVPVMEIMNDVIANSTATFTTALKTIDEVRADIQSQWPCLVVKNGPKVTGYARYFPFRTGPGYAHVAEYSIALVACAQAKGTGRLLLSELCSLARENGIAHLIGAVSSSNDKAIRFHLNNGFAQVGRLPDAGRKWDQSLDLILMQKQL